MSTKPVISIIAPVYNEEPVIDELYRRLSEVMDQIGEPWELIMVNDGSFDGSAEKMRDIVARDERVRTINFARNFGHQNAVTAGMDYARGDVVVIIDADLQDPPEVIADLLKKWREGYHVVYAVRSERKGESVFKRLTAKLFYRLIYRITDVDIPLDTGDFRLMDRQVIDAINTMREHNRFIRGMTSWVGFRQTGVYYVRQERFAGETKYPLKKMIRFALDAITGFSYFPLQVAIYASLVLGLIAVLAVPVVAFLRLATGELVFEGQATTLIVVLLMSSFQFFFFFVMGQYIARIYDEVRRRPLYIVSEVWETASLAGNNADQNR
ncbi:MAG: glycosyltransferase family 2 protein [Anaerolineae bacterium]|nr:glycosyltransferase family 2 protein [Anaerolineae bacterium]